MGVDIYLVVFLIACGHGGGEGDCGDLRAGVCLSSKIRREAEVFPFLIFVTSLNQHNSTTRVSLNSYSLTDRTAVCVTCNHFHCAKCTLRVFMFINTVSMNPPPLPVLPLN